MSDELKPPPRICMMKTLDVAGRCDKEAKYALRIDFRHPTESAAVECFVNVWICEFDHKPPDEEIKNFIAANFETMCVGFGMVERAKPSLELTEFAWCPIAELDTFVDEGKDAAKRAYKQ